VPRGRSTTQSVGLAVGGIGLAILACSLLPKRYVSRPGLGPAPAPLSARDISHYELTPLCGPDNIIDVYMSHTPAEEVERYYLQEMSRYCRSVEGWQVTFRDMECTMWEDSTPQACRYAACVLRNQPPSLYESFSVEIFQLSPIQTYVIQSHTISYLETHPPKVHCGE
jgi:hypothetical protein